MKRQHTLLTTIVAVALGTMALGTPGTSVAQSLIHACVDNTKGTLRIVNAGTTCTSKEFALSWPAEASPSESPNVAQVDMSEGFICTGGIDTYAPIPDLSLSFSTSGGPVLLLMNASIIATQDTQTNLRPIINNVSRSEAELSYFKGAQPLRDIITYQRVFTLPAGAHTFTMEAGCFGVGPTYIVRAWLTVYELR